LITSSAIIDLLTLFLLSLDFSRDVAAVSGLGDCPGIAADHAGLVALPAPPGGIWHYPGFPSLLVTYGVANDYFFSAHTALTVLAATELARLSKRWLAILAVAAVLFEMTTVLVLRAHYTMDAFTGVVTGLYAAHLAGLIADWKQRKARFP
jgi:hypothetical protein